MEGLATDAHDLDGLPLPRPPRPLAEEVHQHEQPDGAPGAASSASVVVGC